MLREREIQIGNDKWFVRIMPHAVQRIKERCGGSVAIDDVLTGVEQGYGIIEKPLGRERQDPGLHILAKIPFSTHSIYVAIFDVGLLKLLTLRTICSPHFPNIHKNRFLLKEMSEQKVIELSKTTWQGVCGVIPMSY